MRTDYSRLWRSFAAKGADVRLMRKEPNRPRLLGAGSISDLKPVSSSPATFPLVLVAFSRPFLVLCFGSSAVPVPRAQVWVLASAQALPLASAWGEPPASVRADPPTSVREEEAEVASRPQVDSLEQVAWPLLRGSLHCRATAEA